MDLTPRGLSPKKLETANRKGIKPGLSGGERVKMESAGQTDTELVAKVKLGDRQSFSELVRRHQRALLRLSLRFTKETSLAEDVVQESFIKAYQKIHLFEGRASFKSWIFQIAMNTAKNRFREKSWDLMNVEDLPVGVAAGAESEMLQTDVRKLIRSEVDRLPERQRIALVLRVFEDLSFKEIAEIMDCPYDTAKANYRHALLKLRDRFEESEELEGLSVDLLPVLNAGATMEVEW